MRRFLAPLVVVFSLLLPPFAFSQEACPTVTVQKVEQRVGQPHRTFAGVVAKAYVSSTSAMARRNGNAVLETMPAYDEVRVWVVSPSEVFAIAFDNQCAVFGFTMPIQWHADAINSLSAMGMN